MAVGAAWLPSVPGYTYQVMLACVGPDGGSVACTDPTTPITENNKGAGIGVTGFNSGAGVGVVVDLDFGGDEDDGWFDDDGGDGTTAAGDDDAVVGSGDSTDTDMGIDKSCMGLLGDSVKCQYIFGLSGNSNCCSCTERPDLDSTEDSTLKVGIQSNCTWGDVVGSSPTNADEVAGGPLVDTTDGNGCLSCCKYIEGTISVGGGEESSMSTCVARECDGECKFLVPEVVNATDALDEAVCSDDAAVTAIILVFAILVFVVLAASLYFAWDGKDDNKDAGVDVAEIDSEKQTDSAY